MMMTVGLIFIYVNTLQIYFSKLYSHNGRLFRASRTMTHEFHQTREATVMEARLYQPPRPQSSRDKKIDMLHYDCHAQVEVRLLLD
jgi:hypothetical protein